MRRVGFGISSRGVTRSNYLLIAEFDPGWGHPPCALCGLMRRVLDLTSPAGGTHLRRILEGKMQGNVGWGSACGTEHRVQMLGRGAQRCVEVCVFAMPPAGPSALGRLPQMPTAAPKAGVTSGTHSEKCTVGTAKVNLPVLKQLRHG